MQAQGWASRSSRVRSRRQVKARSGFWGYEKIALLNPKLAPCRYAKLKFGRPQHFVNHAIVSVMTFLRLAPKGTKEVSDNTLHLEDTLTSNDAPWSPPHMRANV